MVNLDVLVVYSSGAAVSASVDDIHSKHPFLLTSKEAYYNRSYAYFLDVCKQKGLSAGLTASEDVTGPGMCKSYWVTQKKGWKKIQSFAQSNTIFDKISPVSAVRASERRLLLSNTAITPFTDPALHQTFFDKLKTYTKFSEYAVPTVAVHSNTNASIKYALKKLSTLLQSHPNAADFTSTIVVKDRFGSGGNFVYKVENNFLSTISEILNSNPTITFILQPYLSFDAGISYKNTTAATDIRMIFQYDKLIQCYFRMAKADDFRCNEHQGGQLHYVAKKEIPKAISTMAQKIVTKISLPSSLYALDFVVSNSGNVYFIEGNTGPGIDWDHKKESSEKMSKELIECIVNELALRTKR